MNPADAIGVTNGLIVGATIAIACFVWGVHAAIERQTKVLEEIRELLLRRQ